MPEPETICEACGRGLSMDEAVLDIEGTPLCPECAAAEPRYAGVRLTCQGCGNVQEGAVEIPPGVVKPCPAFERILDPIECPACGYPGKRYEIIPYDTSLEHLEAKS